MTSFAAADGTRLHYTETGTGPPLVCLPGGPGRAAAYLEDLGGLARHRTLVLLDPRATGASEVPADPATLRFDRLAADVESLRAHLGLERLDLLGHSAGSVVAQAYAATFADRLRTLVLVTPVDVLQHGGPSPRCDVPQIRARRAGEPWYADAAAAAQALAEGAAGSAAQALQRAVRPFFYGRWELRQQQHAATADHQMSRRAELGFAPSWDADHLGSLRRALRQLAVPVLLVGAERDGVTGVQAVHTVAESFAAARTAVLTGAGHFPWVDEPAAFADLVNDFLAQP